MKQKIVITLGPGISSSTVTEIRERIVAQRIPNGFGELDRLLNRLSGAFFVGFVGGLTTMGFHSYPTRPTHATLPPNPTHVILPPRVIDKSDRSWSRLKESLGWCEVEWGKSPWTTATACLVPFS